jgi:hypothetical protein
LEPGYRGLVQARFKPEELLAEGAGSLGEVGGG